MYSFGVLALETLLGKHPSDLLHSLLLSSSKATGRETLLLEVLDQRLPPPHSRVVKRLVLTTELALSCVNTDPLLRPTMLQVSSALSSPCSAAMIQEASASVKLGELLE